jgi:hypothetical protein
MSVSLSVRTIQLVICWTDLDGIWYGRYAIGVYHKIILLNFLRPVIPAWRTNELVRLDDTSATYNRVIQ